jgi:hypothetical protein
VEIVDLSQAASVTSTITNPATGQWDARLELDLKVSRDITPSFSGQAGESVTISTSVRAIDSTGYSHAKLLLSGRSKLPAVVTLIGNSMDKPLKITVPAPPVVVPGERVDWIVLLSLTVALVIVGAGTAASHKPLWADMGTQSWTFDSWATNIAVGAGVVALITKILPGGDVPFTQLSAILGFIGAIAPTAYNLTTRTVNSAMKGKVLFFALSAMLTSGAVFGQLQIGHYLLSGSSNAIPPYSLLVLEGLLWLVGAAFVYHLFLGTRDTIVAQSPGTVPARIAPRHKLGGGSFTAL